jgi:hypothetical protein
VPSLTTGRVCLLSVTFSSNCPLSTVSGSLVVKALGYKLEGHRFESRWGDILNLPDPSGRTQPITEMSTGNIKKNNVSGK